ncbi:hypothetical protein AU381_10740 [Sinorhizobium glycinis]|uniref:Uncharacterized protein n=1 Tax=Sinorhizobium glycinis TaxID=1472378 RepID=A0A178XXG2_9HYPH|nr:hypothetical protein AU381_10740 [Sinorhizobium glycinis]
MDVVDGEAVDVESGASVVTVEVELDVETGEVGASVVTVEVGLVEAGEVGTSVVTVEVGLDVESGEVEASVVTVEVSLDAAVSEFEPGPFNPSECFQCISLPEFFDLMCISSQNIVNASIPSSKDTHRQ